MGILKKALTLYERGEDGELLPQLVPLEMVEVDKKNYPELVGTKIKIIPMTRGKLKKLFGLTDKVQKDAPETDKDDDAEIIVKYCKEPLYTIEELKYAKPVVIRSIVKTVLTESGVKTNDSTGTRKIDEDEDEFGKN